MKRIPCFIIAGKIKQLPCNYNFMHVYCERGWSCEGGRWKPGGIQIFHGAGSLFQAPGGPHRMMYETYKEVNFEKQAYAQNLFSFQVELNLTFNL